MSKKLYAVYANGSLMHVARGGSVVVESEEQANKIKEAFDTVSEIRGEDEQTDYEVVPYVVDPPVKDYAEQGIAPNPKDFRAAGMSNKAYAYACKHFGVNPMDINTVRTSEQWAEIVELAKKHDIGVAEVENPHNFCEYINTPERPWNVKIDPDNECNLTSVEGAGSKGISELTEEMDKLDKNSLYGKGKHNPNPAPIPEVHGGEEEFKEELHEKLGKKIVESSAMVPTKEVYGLYSEKGEYHRNGKHVVFNHFSLANEYAKRVTPFLEDSVYVQTKRVPVTEKVM